MVEKMEMCIIQCVPGKGFASAVFVQRNREMVYIVSQTADPNTFPGTHCIKI